MHRNRAHVRLYRYTAFIPPLFLRARYCSPRPPPCLSSSSPFSQPESLFFFIIFVAVCYSPLLNFFRPFFRPACSLFFGQLSLSLGAWLTIDSTPFDRHNPFRRTPGWGSRVSRFGLPPLSFLSLSLSPVVSSSRTIPEPRRTRFFCRCSFYHSFVIRLLLRKIDNTCLWVVHVKVMLTKGLTAKCGGEKKGNCTVSSGTYSLRRDSNAVEVAAIFHPALFYLFSLFSPHESWLSPTTCVLRDPSLR